LSITSSQLKRGGADAPGNMQSLAAAKAKDRVE
jgi:hypothetical protein